MKNYSYTYLNEHMEDIIAHPECYNELLYDISTIGYTKCTDDPLRKLIQFINNYNIEAEFYREIIKMGYNIEPVDESFGILEIRNGRNEPDFKMWNNGGPIKTVEVKRVTSEEGFKCLCQDVWGYVHAEEPAEFNAKLWIEHHRYVAIHGADNVAFVNPIDQTCWFYNIKRNAVYKIKLSAEIKQYSL